MKPFIYAILVLVFVTSCHDKPERIDLLSPGISLELATYRKQQVADVVYNLSFEIPESKVDKIKSRLQLNLEIKNLDHPLYLDFNEASSYLKSVLVNHDKVEINHQKEHIIIDEKHLTLGDNVLEIEFDAGELSLNRNEDYLYTLLVPDRASTLFPCFDQPDIKANYILDITAPKDWEVLCGSYIEAQETQGDFIRHQFKESDKMSTYLFSFVAGKFFKVNQDMGGLNMRMLYRENNEEKLAASMDEIFRLHDNSVVFLENYTQYKFPFQKLDFAVIPGFQYGGMEHVGAIQYREASLFLDNNATQNQKLNRSRLIAHETAHMWFGDLVTMKWFDDVWLKEVFANFLADKITSTNFSNINHDLSFMSDHYGSAYSVDRTQGSTPIKQHLDNLKNAGTLYGRIIYNKAPIMMRQLETLVGESAFRKGMQNYIKTYANDNADWDDLIGILDEETPEDLKSWSAVWVNKSGRPIISDRITYRNNVIQRFEILQKAEDGSPHIWPQSFDIGLVYTDSVHVIPVKLSKDKQVLNDFVGLTRPKSIIYNYNAFGYGVFPVDDINRIPAIKNDLARGYSYVNLYENVLSGNIKPQKALTVFIDGVSSEKEELILNSIGGKITTLFWDYISEEERVAIGGRLETLLFQLLNEEGFLPSYKKTLFGLFKSIAYSEHGKDLLYRIWNKSLVIENLNLNENDYTKLAAILAIYNHSHAGDILQKALEDISNPDRKKRFEFLMPSLSIDEKTRDDFVLSLTQAKNREKESWVVTALYYINHPLRQEVSQKHLRLCLDLVEEIQLTGDIFFPKAWLNATIGNYTSAYAYDTLEEFLNDKPDFPVVLKNKLLQASDGVYRAKLIREQADESKK
ncbi:M1 family aminopeptidase [uncultured Algibacter sp.]|uniref:M1 family metallopeptidase n=1 Tax=uncultured Algibacter sp. TaxID=298659 RepID=UPI002635C102|nr:M1 family aminopeptidase [uncultured Algibacter sp.]